MPTVPDELRGRWIWWYQAIGVVIGVAGLIFLWSSIGPARIAALVRHAAPALALAIGIDFLTGVLRARVLYVFLRRAVRYRRCLVAQLSGNAVADLTPAGVLGEPTKAAMLLGHAPAPAVVSAIVAYDLASLYATTIIMLLGIALAATTGDVPTGVTQLLGATAAFLAVSVILGVWLARRGFTTTLLGLLRPSWRERWRAKLEDLDRSVRELHGRALADTLQGIGLHLIVRVVVWIQFAILLAAVGVSVDAHTLLLLAISQGPVMKLSTILPLGLTLTDAGIAAVFTLFGLPAAAGAGVAMLQRVRQAVSGMIGVTTMVVARDRARKPTADAG